MLNKLLTVFYIYVKEYTLIYFIISLQGKDEHLMKTFVQVISVVDQNLVKLMERSITDYREDKIVLRNGRFYWLHYS